MPSDVTRRRFLTWTGVGAGAAAVAGGAALAVTHQLTLPELIDAAEREPLGPGDGVLVVVTLYGGNDGLNTVVPATDPAYQRARPELAYRPEEVLELGDGLGLNPGLTGLKSLWDARRLAVVRGAGYPDPDRSHFRSMAIWQTASPQTSVRTGWLGRWLDSRGNDPLLALSMDPVMPPLLVGANGAGSALASASFGSGQQRRLSEALAALAAPGTGSAHEQAVADSYRDMLAAERAFGAALAGTGVEAEDEGAKLVTQLEQVATLVEAGVPTRVYTVSLGGFDTHAGERGTQEGLLAQVDRALSGFQQRLGRSERGRRVTTMVFSEFGRRVQANASDGTDHGTAGPMLVLGEPVAGGFVGDQPGLTDLVDGDLRSTTDFRDVYATLLERVLDSDVGPVLDGWRGRADTLLH